MVKGLEKKVQHEDAHAESWRSPEGWEDIMLSSLLPRDKAWMLEKAIVAHLRKNRCTACVVDMFWKEWRRDGTLPSEVDSPRKLVELLKRADAGLLRYPQCGEWAVCALRGEKINPDYVMNEQASRYFAGRREVAYGELSLFAADVFVLADFQEIGLAIKEEFYPDLGLDDDEPGMSA